MTTRITGIIPREQAGPRTGRKYEFQYEEAALACLKLLEEGAASCVYCEWHDDFVVEHNEASQCSYVFHQVKTRAHSKGAWSMFEILGIKKPREPKAPKVEPKPKRIPKKVRTSPDQCTSRVQPTSPSEQPASTEPVPPPITLALRDEESIAIRMLDHHRKFKDACALFVMVSPTSVLTDPMLALVEQTKSCDAPDKLGQEQQMLFAALVAAHQGRDPSVTADELWMLLRRLQIVIASASEPDPRVAVGLMGQIILDLSEVDVSVAEQRRISEALLKVVRDRSHKILSAPLEEGEVRRQKSVTLREVIKLLPLSVDGWERLRQGEKAAVKSLSRLQRICRESGMSEQMIVTVADLKLLWHEWRGRVGDSLTKDMLGVLREQGIALLRELTTGASVTRFQDLQRSAETAAASLASIGRMPGGLNAEIVMGLVFALAAESE